MHPHLKSTSHLFSHVVDHQAICIHNFALNAPTKNKKVQNSHIKPTQNQAYVKKDETCGREVHFKNLNFLLTLNHLLPKKQQNKHIKDH